MVPAVPAASVFGGSAARSAAGESVAVAAEAFAELVAGSRGIWRYVRHAAYDYEHVFAW